MNKTVTEVFFIVVVAAVTALGVNHFSPRGIALVGEWDIANGVISAGARNGVVEHNIEIESVALAKKLYDEGEAIFVDARPVEIYEEGHIRGAVSFPVNYYEGYIEGFMEKYPPSRSVVTYCSGRECQDGHRLARYLVEEGYLSVRVFIDGYPVWEEEGLPVE